jgi:hypothetical protein
MQPPICILGKEHPPRIAPDAGFIDPTNELSLEWELTALPRKGELDEIEEFLNRQIHPNRNPPFRVSNLGAEVCLQAAPHLTHICDIAQDISISSRLLESSPVKWKPVSKAMVEIQLKKIPLW